MQRTYLLEQKATGKPGCASAKVMGQTVSVYVGQTVSVLCKHFAERMRYFSRQRDKSLH